MKKPIDLQLCCIDREKDSYFDSIENALLNQKELLDERKKEIMKNYDPSKAKCANYKENYLETWVEFKETETITYTGIFLFLFTKCETVLEDVYKKIKQYGVKIEENQKEGKKPIEEKIYNFLSCSLEEKEYKEFKTMRLENNSIKHNNSKPKKCLYEEDQKQYEKRHRVKKQEFDARSNEEKELYDILDTEEEDNEEYYLVEPKDKYKTTALMDYDKVKTRIGYARDFFNVLQRHLCNFIHDKESAI